MEERREWQKHIFGMAKSAGITDNEDLHALVSCACGKTSLKEITRQDYILIIAEIKSRFPMKRMPQKTQPKTRSTSGMTDGQIRKVWRLMYELKSFDKEANDSTLGKRLCGIIKRELKVDAEVNEPFAWLTYQNGSALIERLKKYVENAEKRCLRGG